MSVTLTTSPAAIAFSADQIFAKFNCTNYIQQLGDFSVNDVVITQPLTPGTNLRIKYSGVDITMMASPNPGEKEFLAGTNNAQDLLPYFESNYSLSRDFSITAPSANKLRFTARTKKLGYNFSVNINGYYSITNPTPGTLQVLRPRYAVFFRLYIENKDNTGFHLFYETKLPILGSSGQTQISIGDKLHNEIMMDLRTDFSEIPEFDPLKCKKSCRKYYFEFAESYGDVEEVFKLQKSPEFTVLYGGLSYVAQFNSSMLSLIAPGTADTDRFLKQGNVTVYTRTNQPQYLYFFNSRAASPGTVIKTKFYLKDGTEVLKSLGSIDLETLRKYAFNLRFDDITTPNEFTGQRVIKYEVWLETATGEKRSEIRTYFMNYEYREYARYFLSWSSFGSLDSHLCYGKGNSEFELFQKDATKTLPFGYDIKQGNSISFDIKLKSSFKVATGWMSKREMLLNRDFFLSPFKYRYTGGLMLPIKIESKTISENKDGENLYSQLFDYSYQFEDHNFTEGDNEDSGVSTGDFFFNSDPVIGNSVNGLTEKDPTVPRWVKSITQLDIDRWNAGASGGAGGDFSNYYTKSDIKNLFTGSPVIDGYNKTNWDNSFSWGNHAGLYQPLEDQRLSKANNVVFNEIKAINKLFIPSNDAKDWKIYISTDGSGSGATPPPVFTLLPATQTLLGGVKIGTGLSVQPDGTLSVNAEIPLRFKLPLVRNLNEITLPGWDATNWDTAFGWGNHATQGYLKSVSWANVIGKPTALSQFTNDLGNFGNWITATVGSTLFQPLEDQRLSMGDNVVFNEITAINKLILPSTGVRKWKVYIDELGSGGGATAPPVVSSLWDLTNTLRFGSEQNNQVLSYDAFTAKWVNKTLNIDVDLSPYAKRDGSNVDGTWGINVSGTAANATLWNSLIYTGNNLTSPLYFLTMIGGGQSGYSQVSDIKNTLGLGSFAYRNSVHGNEVVTSPATSEADIVVSQMLRWKNYGSGHVIFDASAGTSPTGSAINNKDADNPWAPSYGSLMGWNGLVTYGVRVDSARYADGLGNYTFNPVIRDNADYIFGRNQYNELALISGLGVKRLIGIPDGGSTLQSVMNVGSGTANTLYITGAERPTGAPSGKTLGLEFTGDIGNIFAYDYSSSQYKTLALGNQGRVVVGYTTDQPYKLAVNGSGRFSSDLYSGASIQASEAILGLRGVFGYDSGNSGSVNASNWFRSNGNTGWFNETYQGGIYMSDSTWIRTYNNASFVSGSTIQAGRNFETNGWYKCFGAKGMVGNYDTAQSSDKIIWTIGDQWNEVNSMYGVGYSYGTKYANQHQIVFKLAGNVKASIALDTGNGYFDGGLEVQGISSFRNGNSPGITLGTLNPGAAYLQARTNLVESTLWLLASEIATNTSFASPVVKATNQLFIPEKTSGGQPTGKLWQIYVQQNQ